MALHPLTTPALPDTSPRLLRLGGPARPGLAGGLPLLPCPPSALFLPHGCEREARQQLQGPVRDQPLLRRA